MEEFEDRLRGALRAHARDVRPSPDGWERVEARIRRRQVLTWAAPATAVAAIAAVVVLALPAILPGEGNDIEFGATDESDDGDGNAETFDSEVADPQGTEPSEEPEGAPEAVRTPSLKGRAGAIAWLDGQSLVIQTPEGRRETSASLAGGLGLAVAPGSDAQRHVLLAAGSVDADGGCRGLTQFFTRDGNDGTFADQEVDGCVSAPRFSPDGEHVARIARDEGAQTLEVRPFTNEGTERQPAETATLDDVEGEIEIAGWLPAVDGSGDLGVDELLLIERGEDGSRLRVLPINLDDDGGLELPQGTTPVQLDETTSEGVVAAAALSAADPRANELVGIETEDGQAQLFVVTAGEGLQRGVADLPSELADAEQRAWIFAEGDDILLGDGRDGVWHVGLDGDEPAVVELDADWTSAALLRAEDDETTAEEETNGDGPETTAFFVRSGEDRLWVEPATVPLARETTGVAAAAMEALLTGGVEGLETLAPEGTRLLGASINDEVLTVDLSEEVRDGNAGGEAEEMFAQQLAHTAAQFDGLESVSLLVEGQPTSELWGHLDWSDPIEPDELDLSPVVIEEVSHDDGQVTVSGEATTFEATVELRLANPSGQYAEETFTTSTCGGPCRGEFEHTFDAAVRTAGTWTVKASQPEVSEEAPPPFVATAEVTVD